MEHPLIALIRSQLHPLPLQPTDVTPELTPLSGIQAVLFDVYGTLLVSGSGDIGTGTRPDEQATAAELALRAVGIRTDVSGATLVDCLQATIESAHQQAQAAGVTYPEVEIRDIWQQVASQLELEPPTSAEGASLSWSEQLAVEYEARVNPVWPMPGAIECVRVCQAAHHTLGIVSNAKFFTPLMWRAATGLSLEQTGFDPLMQYFSYVHGRAKPGLALYQLAASALQQRGIQPSQTLYVGNDMKNDILPAAAVGFRTALFAGDRRSLRLRRDEPELAALRPAVTVTELRQLLTVLGL